MTILLNKAPRHVRAQAEKQPSMVVLAQSEKPEILIMDMIGKDFWGDGVPAADIRNALNKFEGQHVTARFNTYGGDAFEGLVIANSFSRHAGGVTAVVDGLAFSAGSIAATGADSIQMQKHSEFGIHRSHTVAIGNRNALQAAIEWLDAVDEHQIEMFSDRTGADRGQVIAWLEGTDDGTLFNATTAVELGFADEIIGQDAPASTDTQHRAASSRLAIAAMRHRHNTLCRKV